MPRNLEIMDPGMDGDPGILDGAWMTVMWFVHGWYLYMVGTWLVHSRYMGVAWLVPGWYTVGMLRS